MSRSFLVLHSVNSLRFFGLLADFLICAHGEDVTAMLRCLDFFFSLLIHLKVFSSQVDVTAVICALYVVVMDIYI
jgi:hypothetical protein